jgi:hypothetical protein
MPGSILSGVVPAPGQREPGGKQPRLSPERTMARLLEQHARHTLPYGCWTCADGREVLFNRLATPMFQRYPGQPATLANPHERVPYVREERLFGVKDPPWKSAASFDRCRQVLTDWGLAERHGWVQPAPPTVADARPRRRNRTNTEPLERS